MNTNEKMTFILQEYIDPTFQEKKTFGNTYRHIERFTWKEIVITSVEMTADEMKDYLIKMYQEYRFVEAIRNDLVWCNSFNYGINYEKDVRHVVINKLEKGMILKNNSEFYEVLLVTKHGLIAKIQNLKTGKVSSHTITEISKHFRTICGKEIEDIHTQDLKKMRYRV